ncbi:helix-turn-helix domain-containing protein [Enterovibrio sp. ZSDZ35]|uniref:Helix-turn-helix domain-containing protein n=1 Tax=Enterovibrio qingdaonensis TaxID=2899818 RepID=A0ABT5QPU3_9GAMM|nr:AraC family transcriptional regulator [Enterovibrio sp. ZSDZ35]MDD1783011.1 helix-turn-helix domain-containing protein [Enterovibrio sp. ZSDZ35]
MRLSFRMPALQRCLIALIVGLSSLSSAVLNASPFFLQFPFEYSLTSKVIKTMEYIEEKGVWLLDSSGAVSYYDGTKIRSLSLFVPSLPEVSDIAVLNGKLYLLIDNKLHHYDLITGKVTPSHYASGLNINDIESGGDTLFVAATSGGYRLDIEQQRVEKLSSDNLIQIYSSSQGVLGNNGNQIIDITHQRVLYEFSSNTQIFDAKRWGDSLFVAGTQGLSVIRQGHVIQRYLVNNIGYAIEKTVEGIWLGTNKGLFLAESSAENLVFVPMSTSQPDAFSFLGQQVTAIERGDKDDLWIASDSGLNFRSSILAGLYRLPSGHLNGDLAEAGISSFVDWQGQYFLGSRNKLVKLNRTLHPVLSKTFNFSIQSMEVLENTLWVATASGLHAYHAESLRPVDEELPQLLREIPIDRLLADEHSVWIASENRILRYWPESQTLVDFDSSWSQSGEARLLSLLDMESVGVWLGTSHGLVHYFDGSFRDVLSKDDVGAVKYLSESDKENLWLVASNGVYGYSMTEGGAANPILNHTENGKVLCAYVHDNEMTYITTKGVFRNIKGHTQKQSVLTTQLTSQSVRYFCEMTKQATYFAGDLGVFSLSTETLDQLFNLPLRPSFVSTVYIDDAPYRMGPLSDFVQLSVPAKSTAKIDISQMPFNLREGVSYQLLGSGSDIWHKTRDNQLVFSALGSGDYTLIVKESLTSGQESKRQLFSFSVDRVWYEQLGVIIIGMLVIALLGFVYFHQSNFRARKRVSIDEKISDGEILAAREVDPPLFVDTVVFTSAELASEVETDPYQPAYAPIEADESSTASDEAWKSNAQAEIDTHFGDPDYTTSSLATALYISERSLQRRFKALFGYTFKEALISTRLENATRMLANGSKVSDVSVACGFNEPSYFSKSFKARYGCTPTQFREKFEEKSE